MADDNGWRTAGETPLSAVAESEPVPSLAADLAPPLIRGPAALAQRAFAGASLAALLAFAGRAGTGGADAAALALDAATAHQLHFCPDIARALQQQALASCRLYRVADELGVQSARPLRLLALMAPGDLMANTPLDFITTHLDVRLDILFVVPGRALPPVLPDHDVAFFAAADSDPEVLRRLVPLHASWPRPVLNHPARVARLGREAVARGLQATAGLICPPIRRLARAAALAATRGPVADLLPGCDYPVLVRPVGSHAGHDLGKADDADALADLLGQIAADDVFVSAFVDYRGADGMFRKYRVAFIDGAPHLCHMAVSRHWMVHYLNAGMAGSAVKRAEEARAMATFADGFARRHAAAFAAVTGWAGLDYFQIDCAEAADGQLLLFEADVAGIVHMMDPPDLYPYKPPQMRRVIDAFGAMLARGASAPTTWQNL